MYQNYTPIWRLHTKLHKATWSISANNSETVGHKDLRLGKIVYILVFLWNFIFLASSTGRFPIYLFFCAVFIAWQWKTIYTIMMTVMKKKKRKTTQVIQFKVVGMLPKNIVVLPEKRTTTTYLQSIWLMHLHCERSYGCPNHYADNRQLNFHCLRKQHHPAKFYHFRHQIEQTLEHLQRQETRVDDKRLVRHLYPSSHHKQFPRCYYDTLQLFLPSFQILQPV